MSERNKQRGAEIKRRRIAMGIKTPTEFARATGRDRATILRVEDGTANDSTYDDLEAWLDAKDFQHSTEADDIAQVAHLPAPVHEEHEEEMLEMSLTIAALGIDAKVKGAADHPEVIREQLLELVRGIMRETRGNGQI